MRKKPHERQEQTVSKFCRLSFLCRETLCFQAHFARVQHRALLNPFSFPLKPCSSFLTDLLSVCCTLPHVGSSLPDQGLSPHHPHWKAESQPLDHQRSLAIFLNESKQWRESNFLPRAQFLQPRYADSATEGSLIFPCHSLQPFSFNDSSEYTLQSSGTVTPTFPLLRTPSRPAKSVGVFILCFYFSRRIS